MVVGFVATADNDGKVVVWKSVDGNPGGTGGGREVVVVEFDAIDFADEFEAVGEAVEATEAFYNGGLVLLDIFIW